VERGEVTTRSRINLAIGAVKSGIVINAILVAVKVLAGVLGNSYALIADGIESASDVASSLIVWRGLAVSGREASEEYHFGYGKAETLSGAFVALMLLSAALGVLISSIKAIGSTHQLPELFTLPILVSVIFVKEFLFRRVAKVAADVGSSAVKGDAWHHRSDAISSFAALVGISIALIGGPGWETADAYAALVCALVIGFSGVWLLRNSVAELMDKAPEQAVLDTIKQVAAQVDGVTLVEKLLARKSGLVYFVDLHVHANPAMSLHDAHILSGKVKSAIKAAVPAVQGVVIHMEPEEG